MRSAQIEELLLRLSERVSGGLSFLDFAGECVVRTAVLGASRAVGAFQFPVLLHPLCRQPLHIGLGSILENDLECGRTLLVLRGSRVFRFLEGRRRGPESPTPGATISEALLARPAVRVKGRAQSHSCSDPCAGRGQPHVLACHRIGDPTGRVSRTVLPTRSRRATIGPSRVAPAAAGA